jgi:hypothetical protein
MRNNLLWNWRGGYGARIRYGARANVIDNYFAAAGGDLDTAQIQTPQAVRETSFSGRLDLKYNSRWSSYMRFFGDRIHRRGPIAVSAEQVVGGVEHAPAGRRRLVLSRLALDAHHVHMGW